MFWCSIYVRIIAKVNHIYKINRKNNYKPVDGSAQLYLPIVKPVCSTLTMVKIDAILTNYQ